VASVLAPAALRQRRTRQIGQPKGVVQFSVDKDYGVGGDPATVELQLQSAVDLDPQGAIISFTRRVFHERAFNLTITR
jgi:hypothetical protein